MKRSACPYDSFAEHTKGKFLHNQLSREQRIIAGMPLVLSIVGKFMRRRSQKFYRAYPHNDLVQVGAVGLIQAVDRFDVSRGTKFSTLACRRISGAIKDYLRSQDTGSRIGKRIGIRFLTSPIDVPGVKKMFTGATQHDAAEFNERMQKVKAAMDTLSPIERQVIECLHLREMKGCEAAKALGFDQSWISVVNKKAIEKIRVVLN